MTDFAYKNLWGKLELITSTGYMFIPDGYEEAIRISLSDVPTKLRPSPETMGEIIPLPVRNSVYWRLV